jgi:ATP-binding cassette subfamily B (MDR/TAP) protein 1
MNFSIPSYRKALSLVAQETAMFRATIRENILLASDEKQNITNHELHEACRDAEIHDFIVSLPQGYETEIGAKGLRLSGGQKQRIAIARALIRKPQVLLLDEATSSLDSTSEALVQAAIERVSKKTTIIAVAHRLATIQNADVIFVLDSGRVAESGSHAQLLRKKGVYHQMVSLPSPCFLRTMVVWWKKVFRFGLLGVELGDELTDCSINRRLWIWMAE